jgi:signal transduction histidine kinase
MSQRSFRETNAVLRELNRELESRVSARTLELERTIEDFRSTRAELDESRRLDDMKNELFSMVSHELRTPLASIHGSLSLLRSGVGGDLAPRARQLVEIAHRNSERLVRLANDVLDLRRIESGALVVRLAPLDVRALMEQALEANQAYASQLGVVLALDAVADGAMVFSDGDLLLQVLTNLLANAARFSPEGEKVLASLNLYDAMVRVSVRDRGPGIPQEFRHRVFERFAQAQYQGARARGGSGLGLSIAKAIVERLGGRIGFASEPGQGATFFFELPEWRPEEGTKEGGACPLES